MKKGITVSILVITVVLMFIIVTTATVIGTRAIQTASHEEFTSKIVRVADDVNQYIIANKTLPTTSEIIAKEGLTDTLVAEINKNNDATNNLFVVDMSKLRTESVNIGTGSVEDMDVFVVAENTNNVYYLKGIEYRGITYHGILLEDKTPVPYIPDKWKNSVVAIVDGVPIPKGFVASRATGENTKAGGMVIYEGTAAVTDANVETAKRTRNQYVWVPVSSADFKTKFIRQNFGFSDVISNTIGTDYFEIEVDENNIPLETQSDNFEYVSEETLVEAQAMYASVKEYQGFYMARYEAGTDNQRNYDSNTLEENVYFVMGKLPYNFIGLQKINASTAEGAMEAARRLYKTTDTSYGVVSTLVYGVQWDTVLQWWLDTRAVDSVTKSMSYGNNSNVQLQFEAFNTNSRYAVGTTDSAAPAGKGKVLDAYQPVTEEALKASGTTWCLSTGALELARINNIYDMAGNVAEHTMEKAISSSMYRGGRYTTGGSNTGSVAGRVGISVTTKVPDVGFRIALYIK